MAANQTNTTNQQEPQNQQVALTEAQYINGRRLLFRNELQMRAETLKKALPAHITADKFIQVVLTTCVNNPQLLRCTPASIVSAVFKSAQLGLMPDSYTGEAHLIPFKNTKNNNLLEAQFIPGYRGLVQLALRSGQVKRFQARAVYRGDEFEYALGTEEFIRHKPTGKSLEETHFYAIIELKNGGLMFEVMTKAEVDQVREQSPNWKGTADAQKQYTIWGKHYGEMGKKTVIRKLSKYAPISPEFQQAVTLDEQADVIGEGQTIDIDYEELTPEEQEQQMRELIEMEKLRFQEKKNATKNNKTSKERADELLNKTQQALKDKN